MLLVLSPLSISSLRVTDKEGDKFYMSKYTALLTRMYSQHEPRSYSDSQRTSDSFFDVFQ